MITFGSLFAGIGGFDLGFERAGMQCKWQVEIDDYATEVLQKHWPNVHRERDITQVGAHNLEAVDVICGGFPCQDISYAGLGAGLDGERSGLFFEAIRVVRQLRPRVVVLENVAALLTRGMGRVLGTLAAIGYDAEGHCIPAAALGAPHIRDRVFIVAYAGRELRQTRAVKKSSCTNTTERCAKAKNNKRCCKDVAYAYSYGRNQRRQRIASPWCHGVERNDWWAVEPPVRRVADGVSRRVDRLRCLGNAVVPQVAEFIGKTIVDAIGEG